MRRTWLAVAALVVVAAIVMVATCDERRDAPGDAAPAASTTSPPVARQRAPRVRAEESTPSTAPTSVVVASAPAATTPVTAQMWVTPVARVAVPQRVVRGRVMDAKGRPVVGVDVEVVSLWLPADVARRERRYAYAHVATGADGTFALPYFEGGPRGLVVKRGDYNSMWRWSSQSFGDEEVYEIVLPGGLPSVTVRVTRASDGEPIAAAEVRLAQQGVGALGWQDGPARVEWGASRTEPGTFRFEEVAAGPMTLYVAAPDLAPFERQIQVPVEGETKVDVALRSGVTVRGAVVDAVTNLGIARARVRWESAASPAVLETDCDGDGKFVLEHLPFEPKLAQAMTAGADGYADARVLPSGLVDGAAECSVTVSLARPATVSLRCVDEARRPLMGVIVAAYSDYETPLFNGARTASISSTSAPTEPDGRTTLAKLHPGNGLRVFFYVDGVRVSDETFQALAAGETRDLGDVVLAPPK